MHSRIFIVSTWDKIPSYIDLSPSEIEFSDPIDYIAESSFECDIDWLKQAYHLHLKKSDYNGSVIYEINSKELRDTINSEAISAINFAESYIKKFRENKKDFLDLWMASDCLWPRTGFLFYIDGRLNNLFDLTLMLKDSKKLYIIGSFDYHS